MKKENMDDMVLYAGYQNFEGCHFEKTSIKVLRSAKCNSYTGNYGTEKLHLEILALQATITKNTVWTFHSERKGKA